MICVKFLFKTGRKQADFPGLACYNYRRETKGVVMCSR